MVLTKQQNVLKALVEHMLSRNHGQPHDEHKSDVAVGLRVLQTVLQDQSIFVISTSQRICDDFAGAMKRPCRHVAHRDMLRGIDLTGMNIIVLHTGTRTVEQSNVHRDIMQYITSTHHCPVIWHIGDWHR